jgi:hypothetical protein
MPRVRMNLVAIQGSPFDLLIYFAFQAVRQGWSTLAIDTVWSEAMRKDHVHTIKTLRKYTEMSEEGDA